MCLHRTHAAFGPPESITQTASRSRNKETKNGISIGSAILHSSRENAVGDVGAYPFFLKIAPSCGRSEPPYDTWFLGSTRHNIPNGISMGSAVHAQLTAERSYTLMGCPFPRIKLPLSMRDMDRHPSSQSKRHLDRFSRFAGGSLV